MALIPCPDCAELLHPDSGDCPWCGRSEASARGSATRNLILLSLGLVTLSEGCIYQAMYGIVCTDSGMCGGNACNTVQSFTGEARSLDGTPLGLAALPTETAIAGSVGWDQCAEDTDSDDARWVQLSEGRTAWIFDLDGKQVVGSGAPRLTYEDGDPTDRFVLEDGALGDGVSRPITYDGELLEDFVIRLEVVGDTDLSMGVEGRLPLVDEAGVTRTLTLTDGGGTLTIAVDPQP